MSKNENTKILTNPISFLASCFGVGLSPIAPGTMGSLFSILFFYFTLSFGYDLQALIFCILIISGFWICGESAKALNCHDHPSIVWDEMSVMYGILLFSDFASLDWIILFLLFRLFDIWKPWPISYIDNKLSGGTGIMLDDVLAGVTTVIIFEMIKIIF